MLNDITPRYSPDIDGNLLDVQYYEIPAWADDTQYVKLDRTKFMQAAQDETLHSM
jgi:hypothetical protein